MIMINKIELWGYRLGSAVIGGACTALTAQAGLGIVHSVAPTQVQMLDLKQLGFTALSGGFFAMVAYLKQSPLPPIEDTTPPSP